VISFVVRQLTKETQAFDSLEKIILETIELVLEGHFCISFEDS
jgi:hypothetical protein